MQNAEIEQVDLREDLGYSTRESKDDKLMLSEIVSQKGIIHWHDRLIGFKLPTELENLLGITGECSAHLEGLYKSYCQNCGEVYNLAVKAGKYHPYKLMRSTLASASRTLAKLEGLDQRVKEKTGRKESINIWSLVLTFPDEISKNESITKEQIWECWKVFWRKIEFVEKTGYRLAALVNLHFWSSARPIERFYHLHALIPCLGVKSMVESADLGLSGIEEAGIEKVKKEFAGRMVPEYGFRPLAAKRELADFKQKWGESIREIFPIQYQEWLDSYEMDCKELFPGEKWDLKEEFRKNPPYTMLNIHVRYINLEERGKCLHRIKYNGRKWWVDFASWALDLFTEAEAVSYVQRLTAGGVNQSQMLTAGSVDQELEKVKRWLKEPNSAKCFGWWRYMSRISTRIRGKGRHCGICQKETKEKLVPKLVPIVDSNDLEGIEWIFVGKKGKQELLHGPPLWLTNSIIDASKEIL